jgi:hypothetical protein
LRFGPLMMRIFIFSSDLIGRCPMLKYDALSGLRKFAKP